MANKNRATVPESNILREDNIDEREVLTIFWSNLKESSKS